jgi:hypothetical protein
MNSVKIVAGVCLIVLAFSAVYAQRETPAGAGDKDLSDRGVKNRSSDLERVTRDAQKQDATKGPETTSLAKFGEIKEDFENLQLRQDEIIKSYTAGKQLDIDKIAQLADRMNKNAVRLEANLFPTLEEKKDKKKSKEQKLADAAPAPLPKELRSIIIELDNSLGSLVNNPMFVNPQAANVDDNAKAHADLKKMILLTAALKSEAEKGRN